MMQMRTHTCGELRLADAGKSVKLVGWMENVRVVGQNFAFVVLRDFYGTTQIVVETEEMMNIIKALNKRGELTASQLSQTLGCPVTTTIRHIDYLRNNNLIFMSRREGLQIFYKLNLKLFRKMKGELDSLLDDILSKR